MNLTCNEANETKEAAAASGDGERSSSGAFSTISYLGASSRSELINLRDPPSPHATDSNTQHRHIPQIMAPDQASAYIDYAPLLSAAFSPQAYANTLVHRTNNPSDTPLDLSTPLSRVLFDVQEVDTSIDALTTTNALPIVTHTSSQAEASQRILGEIEGQVEGLQESYRRLEKEVLERYEAAEEVRLAAERMVRTLRLGRGVQRAVQMARQLDAQVEGVVTRGEFAGMVGAASTVLGLRQLFSSEEGQGMARVQVVATLRGEVLQPAERKLLGQAQKVVREFSMSSLLSSSGPQERQGEKTYAQTEDMKARATNALQTLYLLSPVKATTTTLTQFEPVLLISALQSYLQTALTSSLASLSRALATLPQLDRTLLEISARCQNIVALESLLSSVSPPPHLSFPRSSHDDESASNFLDPLLRYLDTNSLPSFFWRSLAGQLSSRVQEILSRGGVSARTLRSNRDRVREAIRECVDRGSRLPGRQGDVGRAKGGWEREAAVMVGSVVGPLGR